jgi:P-type Ca2+ transporter type 2C
MQIVLLAAGVLSLFPLRQLGTGILLTLGNAVLGLQQEGKAEAAVAALQKMMIVTARVRRDAQEAEIPAEQLVPGDVVSIEAGDVVPADGRLLRAATLEVAESELTGESLPVSKGTAPVREADMPLGDRTDMVYMNTSVTRGAGEFVVTATGMATEVGHISGMLQAQPGLKTPLTRQLDRLSKQLLLVAGVALIASMAVNLSRGYTFNAVFNAAVAFAAATSRARPISSWPAPPRCWIRTRARFRSTAISGNCTWPRTGGSGNRACGSWPPHAGTSTQGPSILELSCSRS